MSNLHVYTFHETGAIAGIRNASSPDGQFHAGLQVTVDLDTMSIVEMHLIPPSSAQLAPAMETAVFSDVGSDASEHSDTPSQQEI